jgi:hypothetical protein
VWNCDFFALFSEDLKLSFALVAFFKILDALVHLLGNENLYELTFFIPLLFLKNFGYFSNRRKNAMPPRCGFDLHP